MPRPQALLTLACALFAAPLAAGSFAVTEVRLFDGREVVDGATVLVTDGTIAAAGRGIELPEAIATVDGRGRTLLPGFIDAHTHSWGDALERSAVHGVTTVLDMFTDTGFAATARRQQEAGEAAGRADLLSAGILATAPGGHGTQYGLEVPTLASAAEADGWVAARAAEGSDYIKIVLEDGSLFARPRPTLDVATARALAEAAHARGLLAVAHATTFARAREGLAAGVDGLVHAFHDQPADAAWVEGMAHGGLFVVPTLTVIESTTGQPSGAVLLDDERLEPLLTTGEIANLRRTFSMASDFSMTAAFETVRALAAAGVPVLAGTDAPNPGTTHGASMHRELELLVEAGLSPRAALTAATAAPAAAFGLDDRGRIAPGLKADLVLVDGDPLADILATRAIVGVWKGGEPIHRPRRAASAAAEVVPVDTVRPLADFDGGEIAASFGWGWTDSTDSMMGGTSTVATAVVDGGADGSAGALAVTGEIRPGFAFPWAGAMFFPGAQPMTPVDLSAARQIVFWAKGSPGTFRVLAFAESLGQMPSQQLFEVGAEWRRVVLELSGFAGADPSGLTGLLWTGGPGPGPFELVIDQIELR